MHDSNLKCLPVVVAFETDRLVLSSGRGSKNVHANVFRRQPAGVKFIGRLPVSRGASSHGTRGS